MTSTKSVPAYTRFHWAKSQPRDGYPKRIHLLEHHLADVGACFEALVAQPTIRARLAAAGGLKALDESTAARLALFAALHDIGKVNLGFQTQIWDTKDFRGGTRICPAGHTLDLTPVLSGEDYATSSWFFDALGWWDEAMSWDDRDGETACALLVATLSHHGLPLRLEGLRAPNPRIWRRHYGLDPERCVRLVGRLVRRWFEAAWKLDAPPLPSEPAFQHMFLGLCTLADWIGSNEEWFPFCAYRDGNYISTARKRARAAVSRIGLDVSLQRDSMRSRRPKFTRLFKFEPNSVQQRAAMDMSPDERLVIMESETGSGKTEAALWRFANMYNERLVDGLYFALPTRAAASQLHCRVAQFADRMFPEEHRPEVVLAVPGYLKAGAIAGHHLPKYEVQWERPSGRRHAGTALGGRYRQALSRCANRRGHGGPGHVGSAQGQARSHASSLPGSQPAGSGRGSRLGRVHASRTQVSARSSSRVRRLCDVDVGHAGLRRANGVVVGRTLVPQGQHAAG